MLFTDLSITDPLLDLYQCPTCVKRFAFCPTLENLAELTLSEFSNFFFVVRKASLIQFTH